MFDYSVKLITTILMHCFLVDLILHNLRHQNYTQKKIFFDSFIFIPWNLSPPKILPDFVMFSFCSVVPKPPETGFVVPLIRKNVWRLSKRSSEEVKEKSIEGESSLSKEAAAAILEGKSTDVGR